MRHYEQHRPMLKLACFSTDSATLEIAFEVYETLARQLPEEIQLEVDWCNFAAVRQRHTLARAVCAAVQADVIVCSVNDCDEFSPLFRDWVDSWLAGRGDHASALVALIRMTPGANGSSNAEIYLRNVAELARMEFFAKEFRDSKN